MYIDGHLAAGILGTFATVGWVLQGVGNGFYFFQVIYPHSLGQLATYIVSCRSGDITSRQATLWRRSVSSAHNPVIARSSSACFTGQDRARDARRESLLYPRVKLLPDRHACCFQLFSQFVCIGHCSSLFIDYAPL